MKHAKKFAGILLALVMVLGLAIPAMAATQTKESNLGSAVVTINNPAKGENYKLFKLFDATVGTGGEISYQCTGEIPENLKTFFTKDSENNVIPAESILEYDPSDSTKVTGTKMTDELKAALKVWAASAAAIVSEKSDGSEKLEFNGLPYGYYVVTVTHEAGGVEETKAAITVTSTTPDASIYDKNASVPTVQKEAGKASYSIGDTVTYTATFTTTNYLGEAENAKQVVEYVITDTLPPFLDRETLKVTGITIGGTDYKVEGATPQFNDNGQITIPWAQIDDTTNPAAYTSIYDQDVQIVITYQAKLTSTTNMNAADKNTVSITANVDNGSGGKEPWADEWKDSAEITTYAAAIHKVDQDKHNLAGAQFTVADLTTEQVSEGVYRVVSYDPASTTEDTVMSTDNEGYLYILGLASDASLTVTEHKAPDGYNKLTESKTLNPQVLTTSLYEESGTRYYDADGNLVNESVTGGKQESVTKNLSELNADALTILNNKGTLLPSTGGMGTTIFYVVGTILVFGAAVLLITRKRMNAEK